MGNTPTIMRHAIPFASAEGEHNLLACFSPTTTLLPINQVIDHAYITLFPSLLDSTTEKSQRNPRGKRTYSAFPSTHSV